jgi:hypothetical protein
VLIDNIDPQVNLEKISDINRELMRRQREQTKKKKARA